MKLISFATALILLQVAVHAQDIHLDPSFNNGGTLLHKAGSSSCFANAVAIRADGGILVGGGSDQYKNPSFVLSLFRPDGSLDTLFGKKGIVRTPFGNGFDGILAIAFDGDGRFVVGGGTNNSGSSRWAIARYMNNGVLDSSFASDGFYITTYPFTGQVTDLQILSDGKIVASGMATHLGGVGLLRLLPDGDLDSTFGNAGIIDTDPKVMLEAGNMVLQPDGKILLSGYTYTIHRPNVMIRLQANGSFDSSFGNDGVINNNWSDDIDGGAAVLLQADGKIIQVVNIKPKGVNYILLERYFPNGTIDSSFGLAGRSIHAGSANAWAQSAVLMPDGRMVVGGGYFYGYGYLSIMALFGYLPNGLPDSSFGTSARITTSIGNPSSVIKQLAVQQDGRIVVAGHANEYIGNQQTAIARYRPLSRLAIASIDRTSIPLSAFPIPMDESLQVIYTLDKAGPVVFTLTDATGRIVQTWGGLSTISAGRHEERLAISPSIACGLYQLRLVSGTSVSRISVIK